MSAVAAMEASLRNFTRELNDFSRKQTPEFAKALKDRIALEALNRIVLRTPVDTGRARGGWIISTGVLPETTETTRLDTTGQETISVGTQVILTADPYDNIHISNNVDYIVYLEEGTSQQAPQGMVNVTFAELQVIFQ